MNTLIIYYVVDGDKVLASNQSFFVNRSIKESEEVLKEAKNHYKGDGEVRIQGYLEVSDEELKQETITRSFG